MKQTGLAVQTDGVKIFAMLEFQVIIGEVLPVSSWSQEGRMRTHGIGQVPFPDVFGLVGNGDFLSIEYVVHDESEVEGIDSKGLFTAFQNKTHIVFRLFQDAESHVSCKTMSFHRIG